MTVGLLDFSCEEIRFEAYKANADGKADSYVRIGLECEKSLYFLL